MTVKFNGRTQRGRIAAQSKNKSHHPDCLCLVCISKQSGFRVSAGSDFLDECVNDALRYQAIRAGGEIEAAHMTLQTYAGHWMTRAYHPETDPFADPPPPNGRIEKIDRYVQSPRYRNRTRMNREAEETLKAAHHDHLKVMTAARDALRSVTFDDE